MAKLELSGKGTFIKTDVEGKVAAELIEKAEGKLFDLRRKIFNTILYYACKKGDKFLPAPFEGYYVWIALVYAVAEQLNHELPMRLRDIRFHHFKFIGQTWQSIEKALRKNRDSFTGQLYWLLKTDFDKDQAGGLGYNNEAISFYLWVGKAMNSVTDISYSLKNEMEFIEDETLRRKCKMIGKSMRPYLDAYIAEIKKNYYW
jgi:hypothetical protein